MPSRRTRGERLIPALLLFATGCSWAFVHGPPSDADRVGPRVECTESRLAPVVDTFFAAGFLAFGIYALTDHSRCVNQHEWFCDLDYYGAGLSGLVAVPFIVSAIHGWTATGQCVAAKSQYSENDSHAPCRTGVERACLSARDR